MRYSYLIARPVSEYIQQSYKEIFLQVSASVQKEMLWQSMSPSSAARLIEKLPTSMVPLGKEDIELDASQALFNYMVFVEQPEKSSEYLAMFERKVMICRPDLYKKKISMIKSYRERPEAILLDDLTALARMGSRSSLAHMQEQIIRYRFRIQDRPIWDDASLKKGISRLYEKLASMLNLPGEQVVCWLTKFANKGFHEDLIDGRGDLTYCSLVKFQYFLASEGIYENIGQGGFLTENEVKDVIDRIFKGFVTSYLVDINGNFENEVSEAKSSGSKAKKDFDDYLEFTKKAGASEKDRPIDLPNKNLVKGYAKKDDDQLVLESVLYAIAFLSLQEKHRKAITSYLDAMSRKVVIKGDEKLSEARGQISAMSEEIKDLKAENAALRQKTEKYRSERKELKAKTEGPLLEEIKKLERELRKERAKTQEAEDRYLALKKEQEKAGQTQTGRIPAQETGRMSPEDLEKAKNGRYIFMCDETEVQTRLLANFPQSSIGSFMKLNQAQMNAADALVVITGKISHSEKDRGANIAKNAGVTVVYCNNSNMDLIAADIWRALGSGKDINK